MTSSSGVAVSLDLLAATPPYEQVRAQLAGHIRAGALRPGDKLPVVRALSSSDGSMRRSDPMVNRYTKGVKKIPVTQIMP